MKAKAVIYARYSSSKQQESSIEGQLQVCSSFASLNNYEIVNTYIDKETSAFKDVDKRVNFLKMIKDSIKGGFQYVIVYALDRFSRNKYETAVYENKLANNNVEVISATEPTSNTPEGKLMRSLLEGMAQFYSENLSQKVKRGNVVHAKQCHFLGGYVPFGYKIVNKCFVLDEEKSEFVRFIFEEYDKGTALVDIANYLNDKGIKTPMGRKFGRSSFHTLLNNKKYIGIYEYMDGDELKEIIDGVPRIIDDSLFYRVQKLYKTHEHRKKRASQHFYLLSNKLYCGCGTKMSGTSSTSKSGKIHYYYFCPSENTRYRESLLDEKILSAIDEIKADNEIRESLVNVVYEKLNTSDEDTLSRLNKEYEKAHREYKALLNNLCVVENVDDDMKELIHDKKQEVEELKISISTHTPTSVSREEVKEFFDFIFEQKENYARNLVNTLINKIVVNNETDIEIYLNAPVKCASTFRWRPCGKFNSTLSIFIV